MAIRWRANGDLVCAAKSQPEEGDTYINDDLHYRLSVLSGLLLADVNHEDNGLWYWVHGGLRLRAVPEDQVLESRRETDGDDLHLWWVLWGL